jgi:hypothetical protein
MEDVAMPRDRWRVTLDGGLKLDLAKLIPRDAGRPERNISCILTYGSGERVAALIKLRDDSGWLEVSCGERQQAFVLVSSPRNFGGLQWYVVCPKTGRRVRVLYRPLGATSFASRHTWGRRAAYASQFLDPIGRAWRIKAKVKARLIGDQDPDEWDLPPKPKGMRWVTYENWEAKYDAAEEALDALCGQALARLMKLQR